MPFDPVESSARSYCNLPSWVTEGNLPYEKVYDRLFEEGLVPEKIPSRIGKKERLHYEGPKEEKEKNCLLSQLKGPALATASRIFANFREIDQNRDGAVDGAEFETYTSKRLDEDPEFYEENTPPLARGLWRFSALYTLATTEPPKPDAGVTPLAAPPSPPKLPEAVPPPPKLKPAPPPPPPAHPPPSFDLTGWVKDHWPWLAGAAAAAALLGILIYLRRPRPMFDLVVDHGGGYFRKLFPVTKGDGRFLAGRFGVQRTRIGWEIQRGQVKPFRDFVASRLSFLEGDVQVQARGRMGILDDYLEEARLAAQGTEPPRVTRPPRITGTEPTLFAPEVSGAAARRPSGPQPVVRVDESRLVPPEQSIDEALGGRPQEVPRPDVRTVVEQTPTGPPTGDPKPTWLREGEEEARRRLERAAADKPPTGKPPGDS